MNRNWDTLVENHQNSIQRLQSLMEALDDQNWFQPVKKEGWTPSQIIGHILKVYDAMLAQIELIEQGKDEQVVRVRTGWFTRKMLRWTVLRKIFNQQIIPDGAKAPHEFRPGKVTASITELSDELTHKSDQLVIRLHDHQFNSDFSVSHHLFGKLSATQALHFISIHNQHHSEQIADFMNQ